MLIIMIVVIPIVQGDVWNVEYISCILSFFAKRDSSVLGSLVFFRKSGKQRSICLYFSTFYKPRNKYNKRFLPKKVSAVLLEASAVAYRNSLYRCDG